MDGLAVLLLDHLRDPLPGHRRRRGPQLRELLLVDLGVLGRQELGVDERGELADLHRRALHLARACGPSSAPSPGGAPRASPRRPPASAPRPPPWCRRNSPPGRPAPCPASPSAARGPWGSSSRRPRGPGYRRLPEPAALLRASCGFGTSMSALSRLGTACDRGDRLRPARCRGGRRRRPVGLRHRDTRSARRPTSTGSRCSTPTGSSAPRPASRKPDGKGNAPVNRFSHARELARPEDRDRGRAQPRHALLDRLARPLAPAADPARAADEAASTSSSWSRRGPRTSATSARSPASSDGGDFAIVGPGFDGKLPRGVDAR